MASQYRLAWSLKRGSGKSTGIPAISYRAAGHLSAAPYAFAEWIKFGWHNLCHHGYQSDGAGMTKSRIHANNANVFALAVELPLDDSGFKHALDTAGLTPDKSDWLRFVDRFLMAVGVALVVAGVAAFFAWNWADLDHIVKFGLIQAGLLGAIVFALRSGIDSGPGRSSLFGAAFLVGVLLAVFGQTYQTGADPYGLFLGWALLILPLAIVGRQAGLWLLIQVLLNLTVIMYWTQVLHPPNGLWELSQLLGPLVWLASTITDSRLGSCLFVLNSAGLVAWEVGAASGARWLQGRSFPRFSACLAFSTVLIPTLILIIGGAAGGESGVTYWSPVLWLTALVLSHFYYQYKKLDLLILTLGMFGAIFVIMSLVARFIVRELDGALILAVMLIGLAAGAGYWLKEIARRWKVTQ